MPAEDVGKRPRAPGAAAPPAAVAAAAAVAGPALVTLIAFAVVPAVVPALVYVVAISAAALVGGVAGGLVAALLSFLAFTYFFTPPSHDLAVSGSADWVSIAVFVLVAVGMSQFIVRERRQRLEAGEAQERSEETAEQLLLLEGVARRLLAARSARDVVEVALTAGLAAAGARAGAVARLTPDGDEIEVLAQRGYDERRTLDRWGRFPLDRELPLSEAVRTGRAVYVASRAERDRRYPLLAEVPDPSHALACLPLLSDGRTVGGLVLSFAEDDAVDAGRRALAQALAAQVAQALERARLDDSERELRDRLAFLAEAGAVLAGSLDYEETLRQVADLAVPRLADWCSIDMLADDGTIRRLAVAHQDPDKVRYAWELGERYPVDPDETRGVPQVLRSGEPEFIPAIPDELLVEVSRGDEELLRIVRELGFRSAITVPLVAHGRTLGALTLVAAETVPPYTERELELAGEIARRAALAVDNARIHEEVERRADAARALRHVTDAVVLVDRRHEARYWNDAALRLLRARPDEPLPWAALEAQLGEQDWPEGRALTLPVELGAAERWLAVSRVEFEDGFVFALRDVTEERLLERTRSEFVATASHELRTPIAAVYGTFQTLLRPDITLPAERRDEFLRIGLDESERLRLIVDDLLLAGQLDGGAPAIETTRCEVAPLVAEVVEAAERRSAGTHTLRTDIDPALAPVDCDPMRLRQILTNLVENAIKYSPDGGTITLSAASDARRLRLEVADEGIGIPDDQQERIFERFVRLDPGLARGVGGAGLGLYITRELVERMGGTIGVRSREGEGATFTVALPVAGSR